MRLKLNYETNCINNVLASLPCDHFSLRISTVTKPDSSRTEREWMSYKQITNLDGIPLFEAKLAQWSLEKQAVPGLDPRSEATKTLPEAERLQYRRATLKDVEGVTRRSPPPVVPKRSLEPQRTPKKI